MNELLFFIHISVVIVFLLIGLKMGKKALTGLISFQTILANMFVIKQISLFGFTVTCSDVFAVGTMLGFNLLQEYFGKESAKKAVSISFVTLVFYMIMTKIHLIYEPSIRDCSQLSFETLFSSSSRIVFASLVVFYLVQRFDVLFFSFLKKRFLDKHFSIRLIISVTISQFIDTVLFTFLGLYGLIDFPLDVIVVSFSIKMLIMLCSTPFISFSKKIIQVAP